MEAAECFYSRNLLDFSLMEPDEIAGFLRRIGRNAHHIRRVVISFPWLRRLNSVYPGRFDIVPEDAAALKVLRQGCPALQTIRTGRRSTGSMVHWWTMSDLWYWKFQRGPDHGTAVKNLLAEAFGLYNAHFRNIATIKEVILELDEAKEFGPPLIHAAIGAGEREEDHVRYQMQQLIRGYGWKLDSAVKGCDEAHERPMMELRRRMARTRLLCESTPETLRDEYFLSMF
ncbi:hypothetical protein PG984_015431 [Apiospora sp. TS-2023a]